MSIENEKHAVLIPAERAILRGILTLPKGAAGQVILLQGAGRSHVHHDIVTKICHKYQLATLLVEFAPSEKEDLSGAGPAPIMKSDIFLPERSIEHIAQWLRLNPKTTAMHLGFFAMGANVAPALIAAARQPALIKALVLCGGRTDLALEFLPQVKAPVLLIAGGRDPECFHSCQSALSKLNSASALHVIPRASHLFEEPDSMEELAQLTALWFSQHLA